MTEVPQTILTLGALLLLGLVAEGLGRRTPVPRVTLLLLIGVLAGPAVLDLLPAAGASSFPIVANIALVMIGFLLGGEFTGRHLRGIGGTVLGLALAESVTTAIVVSAGLLLLGVDVQLALPLGGVAAATAPAATLAVLQETDARGRFAEILKGVVAVDDVMAILLFSVLLAAAGWITGEGLAIGFLRDALREVGGAVALGLALGLPAAALTGRLQPGRASLEEALGLVLVCVGLAMWLEVSSILAAIVMGGTIANLASHHERPFHEIENIEWPFLVVFFLLAGASLDIGTLGTAGPATIGYVLFRAAGKLVGPPIGGRMLGSDREDVRWLGLALMPQAGVALGLALAAAMRFPSMASDLLNVVVTGTVVFELAGPVLTRLALRRTGALSDQ